MHGPAPSGELSAKHQVNPFRVLIVDDHDSNRALLRAFLCILGIESLEARDGQEAIFLARRDLPDLILMDLQMPYMDGLEATEMLKETDATRAIPVVAISSECDIGSKRLAALQAGCEECIRKPLDLQNFKRVLARYITVA